LGSDPDFLPISGSRSEPAGCAHFPEIFLGGPAMPIDLLIALAPFFALFVLWVLED
jgi:hypothetical protein